MVREKVKVNGMPQNTQALWTCPSPDGRGLKSLLPGPNLRRAGWDRDTDYGYSLGHRPKSAAVHPKLRLTKLGRRLS